MNAPIMSAKEYYAKQPLGQNIYETIEKFAAYYHAKKSRGLVATLKKALPFVQRLAKHTMEQFGMITLEQSECLIEIDATLAAAKEKP